MLMPSIFGEDLFDDFMGYPTGRQAAAYPQVKDMMKTDIRDVCTITRIISTVKRRVLISHFLHISRNFTIHF